MDNSPDLRNRMMHQNRDLREAIERIQGQRGWRQTISRDALYVSLWTAAKIDQFLGYMTWMEEYNRVFQNGKSYFGPHTKLYDHDAAVYSANKLFRKWYGSYATVNLPAILRGGETQKLMTTLFYSYANAMYNVSRDAVQLGMQSVSRNGKGLRISRGAAFRKALSLGFISFIVPGMFNYMYNPDIIEDDDSWTEVTGKLMFGQITSTVAILRDIGAAALGGSFRTTGPITQIFDQIGKGVKETKNLVSGDPSGENWIKDLFTGAGYLTGLPLAQPGKSAQFFWNYHTGHDTAHDFRDWFNGVVYGTTKGKKKAGHLFDPKVARKRSLF